jgi:ABC-2 type transport system ATP-binding protein
MAQPSGAEVAIEVDGLRKSYPGASSSGRRKLRPADDVTWAVGGLSLHVRRGEIFAFLGPNGAGKTTTVEILEGFRRRDGGDVRVLGVDPEQADRSWRARIGIVLQEGQAQANLTVRETLALWAAYYPRPKPIAETIALVGLEEKADDRVGRLSGGQRRRLDVGLALIGDPELIFLDEPTTGFDPAARRAAWAVIADLRELGKTIFLTTHYLDEAQALADRVAIIKAGRIVAQGPPQSLGASTATITEVTFLPPAGVALHDIPAGPALELGPDGIARLRTELPTRLLAELCGWAAANGIELEQLEVTRPTLEDIYLELIASGEPAPAS